MGHLYEIFTAEADGDTKNGVIDTTFGLPNTSIKTTFFRKLFKHKDQDLWAGLVDDEVTNACSSMTPEDRALNYDDSDLKTYQNLVDDGWFEPY